MLHLLKPICIFFLISHCYPLLSAASYLDVSLPIEHKLTLSTKSAISTDDGNLGEFNNKIQLTSKTPLWEQASLTSIIRGRHITHRTIDPINDISWRELYLEQMFDSSKLTVGRQQVVWGKADALRLLDTINPVDFKGLVLDPYLESRIALWMVNAEWYFGENTLQLLVIPDIEENRQPKLGDRFFSIFVPDQVGALFAGGSNAVRDLIIDEMKKGIAPTQRPDHHPANWEYAVKWQGQLNDIIYSVNYFYSFADDPVNFIDSSSSGFKSTPTIVRNERFGGSFEAPIGPIILRGELIYDPKRYFLARHPTSFINYKDFPTVSYMTGVDIYLNQLFISPQIVQEIILDAGGLLEDKTRTALTLVMYGSYMQDIIRPEIKWYHELNENGGLLSLKVPYLVNHQIEVALGADFFYGPQNSPFGAFSHEDQFYLEMTGRF